MFCNFCYLILQTVCCKWSLGVRLHSWGSVWYNRQLENNVKEILHLCFLLFGNTVAHSLFASSFEARFWILSYLNWSRISFHARKREGLYLGVLLMNWDAVSISNVDTRARVRSSWKINVLGLMVGELIKFVCFWSS